MIDPTVLLVFAVLLILVGAVGMSLYAERVDHRRRTRIRRLETELKLANAIVDTVAPSVDPGR